MRWTEEKEYDRYQQRYIKRTMGMWTGLDSVIRILLSPVYALGLWWMCVKGTPIRVQTLHEEDYEPEYDVGEHRMRCPHCRRPMSEEVDITFKVQT